MKPKTTTIEIENAFNKIEIFFNKHDKENPLTVAIESDDVKKNNVTISRSDI